MLYQLVSLRDSQVWDLELPATIGRGPACCVFIDHESVSRSHCQFLVGPDESLQVRDMGSLNGTYVNGERIKAIRTIIPGDSIQVGAESFRVEFSSDTGIREPRTAKVQSGKSSVANTQPIKTINTPTFTMHEVVQPTKQWWEFWKAS